VVDDEPPIRALIAKIVERAGYPVDVARDGDEAIAKLDATLYDVLVIDLMMPNIDGYDVVNHLRDQGGPRPAIIVITAGDASAIRQLDGSIVHSVVRKPFDIDVLADLITAAAQTMETERAKNANGDVLRFPGKHVC
jgi:two-component system OmpR family response regulator